MTVTLGAPANAAAIAATAKASTTMDGSVDLTATDGILARLSPTEIIQVGALLDNLGTAGPVGDIVTLGLLDDLLGGLLPGGDSDGDGGGGLIGGLLPGLGDGLDDLVGGLLPGIGDPLGDLLDGVVGGLLPELLPDLDLGQLLPGLGDLVGNLLPTLGDLLGGALLGSLIGWGGLDLTGPLEILGVNVVTTGPPFGAAALVGLNLGWVPALPSLIAHEVTSTRTVTDLGPVLDLLGSLGLNLGGLLGPIVENLTSGVRLPIVTGWGLGAMSAGMAYPQIAEHFDDSGLLTLMPYLLLNNWGRADGGIAARFAPLLDPLVQIFGYESVVTPEVANSGSLIKLPILDQVAAGFVPIKVDGAWEYSPFADFAAWPNPVTLANNLAALAFPTYLLRGGDLPGFLGQLLDLDSLAPDALAPGGSHNNFLTAQSDRLPLLELFRYPADLANLFTLGLANFSNPFADAVEPALKILTDLGYTNVVRNSDGTYERDFSDNFGSEHAPFMTLPDVDWGQVPGDVTRALIQGFTEAFLFGGIPGVNNPYLNGTREGITSGNYNTNLLNVVGQVLDSVGGLLGGGLFDGLLSTNTTGSALDVDAVDADTPAASNSALFQDSDPASFSALSTVVEVDVPDADGVTKDATPALQTDNRDALVTGSDSGVKSGSDDKVADADEKIAEAEAEADADAGSSERGSRLITDRTTEQTEVARGGAEKRRSAVTGKRGGVERSTLSRPDRGNAVKAERGTAGQRSDGLSRAGVSGKADSATRSDRDASGGADD